MMYGQIRGTSGNRYHLVAVMTPYETTALCGAYLDGLIRDDEPPNVRLCPKCARSERQQRT